MKTPKIAVRCLYRGADRIRFKVSLAEDTEELTIRTGSERNLKTVDGFCARHGMSPFLFLQHLVDAADETAHV